MTHDQFNLSAFYDGELSESEAAIVQAHIESCPACQLELVRLAELSHFVRDGHEPAVRISQIELARLKATVLQPPIIQQTALMHTARWLMRFAAGLLMASGVAAIIATRGTTAGSAAFPATWEIAAIRPASMLNEDSSAQTRLADWVATDLSQSGNQQ